MNLVRQLRNILYYIVFTMKGHVFLNTPIHKLPSRKEKKNPLAHNSMPSTVSLHASHHHHHHRQSLNCEGRWGTTDDFAISFLHLSLFSTALWDLPSSRPVHSLMLSSHLFLCPPCLLPPFTVPCKMVLARPDERET